MTDMIFWLAIGYAAGILFQVPWLSTAIRNGWAAVFAWFFTSTVAPVSNANTNTTGTTTTN